MNTISRAPQSTQITIIVNSGEPDNCHHHHHGVPSDTDGNLKGRRAQLKEVLDYINSLPIPRWAKALLKNDLLQGRNPMMLQNSLKNSTCGGQIPTLPGMLSGLKLPSEAGAAKTIYDFQRNKLGGAMISNKQMMEMADTGYITLDDERKTKIALSPAEQVAAMRFMADGGALFKKMEDVNNGRHDGFLATIDYEKTVEKGVFCQSGKPDFTLGCHCPLPSASKAAQIIFNFQNNRLNGGMLSAAQMLEMARTGYLTTKGGRMQVPRDVQDAARRFMANGGALFKAMKATNNGAHVGMLATSDYLAALKDGSILGNGGKTVISVSGGLKFLPSASDAVDTMKDFQKNQLGSALISAEQMNEMATTGYLAKADGTTKMMVPPEVQEAAQRFMANGGQLFKDVESSTDEKHDGWLGLMDYDNARQQGKVPAAPESIEIMLQVFEFSMPSASSAAKTMQNFQEKTLGGETLSNTQMDQMARTGYLTRGNQTIEVPPEVQAAAQRFMANGGELFKLLSAANSEQQHDGLLAPVDYKEANKKGLIPPGGSKCEFFTISPEQIMPSAASATKTIHDFQQNVLNGEMLSASQMDEMARTGFLTRNGKSMMVPPEVQAAAQRYMANGGQLFKLMEAVNGPHDGLLATIDYDKAKEHNLIPDDDDDIDILQLNPEFALPSANHAANTIYNFQKNTLDGEMLSAEQMQEMASTGYLKRKDGIMLVPPEVQEAAQRYMANGGELFKLMAAINGQQDGWLATIDYEKAVSKGMIPGDMEPCGCVGSPDVKFLPSASAAVDTMQNFHKGLGEMISNTQMDEMARTGFLTKSNGDRIMVPPEVQEAAQRFMANGGELLKLIEAANNGLHDGWLATIDYDKAKEKHLVAA
ncbi:hypothetical protein EGT07_13325 [Herbaspirillum sp. HC18]|nr:hypothetical protein EGT07_13325 [Herbaspirillum sp. HC18]